RDNLRSFSDAGSVSSWARENMQWAVAEGLIEGSGKKLSPQDPTTRAQAATILMRFCEDIMK
ncbi:MAG: S-layer homology domain-containing protein, partial [Firmicutes bacterium]|nr:S-layer homology domain-containing protein [Bacillota bacterium]